ncbi:MAG: tetratricopeptide repeat protein [Phaeospirillum sp.]|nr:tetratricopeptide repeat protein [Phaeospirillum sp.]
MAAVALAALAMQGCATTGQPGAGGPSPEVATAPPKPWAKAFDLAEQKPGVAPSRDTLEGSLWMAIEKMEQDTRTSGTRIQDKQVNDYVQGLVCKLAGAYCPDVRVYVTHVPQFNAFMTPNGMMQVWTGLLLRTQNEAQLATVLGHEIGHFLQRHSVKRYEDAIAKTNLLAVFQIAAAAGGVPVAGDAATLVTMGSIASFSRDNEREADDLGMRLLVENGYDAREASKIWDNLIAEMKADEGSSSPLFFLASHPPSDERSRTLKTMAGEARLLGNQDETGAKRYRRVFLPHRGEYLRDELNQRRYGRFDKLLDQLIEDGANVGELLYFRGELYRQRGKDGDLPKALAAYEAATAAEGAPPELYRALGLLRLKSGDRPAAGAALERFLALRPDAPDRDMIRMMIDQTRQVTQ